MRIRSPEEQIIVGTIKLLLDRGYAIAVFDGEEFTTKKHNAESLKKNVFRFDYFLRHMKTTDEDYLMVYEERRDPSQHRVGWVRFVYGNESHEVLCDHTMSLEAVLKPMTDAVNKYMDTL